MIFIDDKLSQILINYKFINLLNNTSYRFNYKDYYDDFINNNTTIVNILELAYDFNHAHLIDLISTHYDKETLENINNINNIHIYTRYCIICDNKYEFHNYFNKYVLKKFN